MLILRRMTGEKIYIGDTVVVTVVSIDRNRVQLGVEAPRDVPVYRQESPPATPANANREKP